ncbi:hypothetical protein HRbin30_02795 [bacterium HR30]|nr:hypothetical protein HRbin30_02795 [bacterium HR30]
MECESHAFAGIAFAMPQYPWECGCPRPQKAPGRASCSRAGVFPCGPAARTRQHGCRTPKTRRTARGEYGVRKPCFRGHRVSDATGPLGVRTSSSAKGAGTCIPFESGRFSLRACGPHAAAWLPHSKNTPHRAGNMECESHAFAGIALAMPLYPWERGRPRPQPAPTQACPRRVGGVSAVLATRVVVESRAHCHAPLPWCGYVGGAIVALVVVEARAHCRAPLLRVSGIGVVWQTRW